MPEWVPTVVVVFFAAIGGVVFLWRSNVRQNRKINRNGTKIEVHRTKIKVAENRLDKINGSLGKMADNVGVLSVEMGEMKVVQKQSHEDLLLIKRHLMPESGEKTGD